MLLSALVFSVFATTVQAGKRGLCWTWYGESLDPGVFNNGDGEVVAIYDYETYPPVSTNGNGGLGFIGMQRCLDCSSSPIDDLYSRWESQQWATVFSLNEPDLSGISPGEAAAWYIKYINPLPIMKALPSVSSSTTPGEGLSWISEMIDACAGQCYYNYISLHWYGNSFEEFQSYIESAHAQFPGNQLVVPELALLNPPGGQADQVAFFQQAFRFLDDAPYVEFYFPFPATSPSLLAEYDQVAVAKVGTGSCLFNDDGSPSAEVKQTIVDGVHHDFRVVQMLTNIAKNATFIFYPFPRLSVDVPQRTVPDRVL